MKNKNNFIAYIKDLRFGEDYIPLRKAEKLNREWRHQKMDGRKNFNLFYKKKKNEKN